MERSILGLRRKDKIRNTTIRAKTGMVDVGYEIKKFKFKYAGDIIRGEDEWSKKVIVASVRGLKKEGKA